MKQLILFLTGLGLTLTSCVKLEVPEPKTATEFKNLKVNESFSWQTSRPITLKITGIQTAIPVRATLLIMDSNGDTLRRENRLMEENTEMNLQVSSICDSIVVSFGSIRKSYKIESEIKADYMMPIQNEEN